MQTNFDIQTQNQGNSSHEKLKKVTVGKNRGHTHRGGKNERNQNRTKEKGAG